MRLELFRTSTVRVIAALAALMLLAVACGSDASDETTAGVSGEAAPSSTTAAPTTTAPTPTTIPLVTVPTGGAGASSSTVPPGTTPPGGQNQAQDPGQPAPDPADPADPANPANPADPAEPASPPTTLPSTGIPELDDILGGQEVIDPPEGAGTAMRATIAPIDGLAVGDVVTIDAENAPPGQLMAYAQCTEAAAESVVLLDLLSGCGAPRVGNIESDGTVSVTVTVAAGVGPVDCRVETCVVGLIVFPGTDGLRAYEPITLAG